MTSPDAKREKVRQWLVRPFAIAALTSNTRNKRINSGGRLWSFQVRFATLDDNDDSSINSFWLTAKDSFRLNIISYDGWGKKTSDARTKISQRPLPSQKISLEPKALARAQVQHITNRSTKLANHCLSYGDH
jgi:hypothetical protein